MGSHEYYYERLIVGLGGNKGMVYSNECINQPQHTCLNPLEHYL